MSRVPRSSLSRRTRILSIAPLVVVLLAVGAWVYVTRTPQAPFAPVITPLSVDEAVSKYRQNPAALRPDIPPPAPDKMPPSSTDKGIVGFTKPKPGVYTYKTKGQDWVEYGGQKYVRDFPAESPATIRDAEGCAWELYFQAAKEYTDAHVQCSAEGTFLCLAHMQEVTFGTVTHEMTHRCVDPPMMQVGGKVVSPGGTQEVVCHASDADPSRIVITFKGTEDLEVAGQKVAAYHVRLDSFVEGAFNGTAVADVWYEQRTGLYLKLVRSQNTWTKLEDGTTGTYRVEAVYELASLEPRTA